MLKLPGRLVDTAQIPTNAPATEVTQAPAGAWSDKNEGNPSHASSTINPNCKATRTLPSVRCTPLSLMSTPRYHRRRATMPISAERPW